MKKFAKFIPVALGLLTLASCSNDNLFSESQEAVQLKDGDMLVTMAEPQEDGDAFTRGYTSRDMVSRRWFSGIDKLRVYGLSFSGPFDTYMFVQGLNASTGQFQRMNSSTSLADPSWALFPYDQIVSGKWEQLEGLYNSKVTVDMSIPQVVEYDAAYDAANYDKDKQPYYLDNLPRWGKVTATNNGANLETTLNWMTGVLRIQLAGAPAYSNGIRVQVFENGDRTKPIRLNSAGGKYWTVQIAHNNDPVKGACIEFKDDYATGKGFIDGALYVHMKNVNKLTPEDAKKAVVFLPLPVTPGKQVEIVVSAWDYATAGKKEWQGDVVAYGKKSSGVSVNFENCWKVIGEYKNKNIKLGYLYGNKSEYNLALDGTNPGAISDALELIETSEDVITVVANNPIDVCKDNQQTTIEIPNKVGKKQIVLDLRNGLDGCDDDQTLNIVYKDATDKFKGNVTLITPASDGTHPVKLNVDLDQSGFQIVQGGCLSWNGADGNIDIDATEFVLGNTDITTPTKITLNKKVKFSQNVEAFTIAKEAELVVADGIVIDQTTSSDPEKWTYGGVKTITVNGYVDGKIDATTKALPTTEVAVVLKGDVCEGISVSAPKVSKTIQTNGTVDIEAGLDPNLAAVGGSIIAGKAVTATGFVKLGANVTSLTETVSLSKNVEVVNNVNAKGNINIIEEAKVPNGTITSEEGNITIDNAYEAGGAYAGAISADKGIVSLNQVGTGRTTFSGDIIANEFVMTGLTVVAADVTAHGTATINVDAQDGACPAISKNLTLDHPTANELNLTQGYVKKVVNDLGETKLTFASTAAYAAIGGVTTPKKLIPQNVSIWNGDYKLEAYSTKFDANGYNTDGGRIWTATQLGYQNTTATDGDVIICSDIDLDNQSWPGIEQTAATNVRSFDLTKAKTISNLKLIGRNTTKTAGFYTTCAEALTVTNLTFDGVSTEIKGVSGGVYDGGIGAIAGRLAKGATLTRVKVTLAGTNFGATLGKNAQTANVGGLLGATGWANLIGCEVDATGVALTGYKCMGGFIGRSYDVVNIKMAEEDYENGIPEAYPTVTGLEFNVTYDATKAISGEKNDQYQGSTGWFIGSINYQKNLTISDIQTSDLKRKIVQAAGSLANEKVACLIESLYDYYWFVRTKLNGEEKADQTLIGNSGFEYDPGAAGDMKIMNVFFEIHKTGKGLKHSDSKKLYSLIKDAYNH